jgi:hypothetical protein
MRGCLIRARSDTASSPAEEALRYGIALSVGGFEIMSSASIVLDTVH